MPLFWPGFRIERRQHVELHVGQVDDRCGRAMRGIDGQVRGLAIERIPDGVQIPQTLTRIRDLQQRTLGVTTQAAREVIRLGTQVDDGRGTSQGGSIVAPQHCSPAGCDDRRSRPKQQLAEHLLLDVPKGDFTFTIEELADGASNPVLDLVIDVQKRQLAHARELPPDRGFSTTGHTDKADQGPLTQGFTTLSSITVTGKDVVVLPRIEP